MTDGIGLGVKVYSRIDKLEKMLKSVPDFVETVYIADDRPMTNQKRELYDRDFPFEFVLRQIERESGIGRGREALCEASDEEYMLFVDPDHLVPPNAYRLVEQLQALPDVGAVGGGMVEPENNQMFITGSDFEERNGKLVRGPLLNQKSLNIIAGAPYVPFDMILQVGVFRRECLEDYCWDPAYDIECEHLDFFLGHWKRTDWEFGVCPEVYFPHYPGGDDFYLSNRHDPEKVNDDKTHFEAKWGYDYDDIILDGGYSWFSASTYDQSLRGRAVRIYNEEGPLSLLRKGSRFVANKLR